MLINRKKTREIRIGSLVLGGNNPIRIQSMCNTQIKNTNATIKQIHKLEELGCELIRIAIPDLELAKLIKKIKKQIKIPLIADIHYDHKLALECLKQGIDKIRINPGNMPKDKLKIIIKEAKNSNVPIRIGINIGSLPKNIIRKFGCSSKAMVESAIETVNLCENIGFYNLIVSLKSSDILQTVEANTLFSEKLDYPLHLGITEAGTIKTGVIKSSIGIGSLLMKGIGDTIRVSLTANPTEEVLAGYRILRSLGLRKGPVVISCPMCGRAKIDVVSIANEIEKKLVKIKKPIKIGILGCFVNAEEIKMADIGIAGAENYGIFFKKGRVIKKIEKNRLVDEFSKEVERVL